MKYAFLALLVFCTPAYCCGGGGKANSSSVSGALAGASARASAGANSSSNSTALTLSNNRAAGGQATAAGGRANAAGGGGGSVVFSGGNTIVPAPIKGLGSGGPPYNPLFDGPNTPSPLNQLLRKLPPGTKRVKIVTAESKYANPYYEANSKYLPPRIGEPGWVYNPYLEDGMAAPPTALSTIVVHDTGSRGDWK